MCFNRHSCCSKFVGGSANSLSLHPLVSARSERFLHSSVGFLETLMQQARLEFPQWSVGTDIDGKLPVTLEPDPKSKAGLFRL